MCILLTILTDNQAVAVPERIMHLSMALDGKFIWHMLCRVNRFLLGSLFYCLDLIYQSRDLSSLSQLTYCQKGAPP